jgi:predicted dienelactone hydrolase
MKFRLLLTTVLFALPILMTAGQAAAQSRIDPAGQAPNTPNLQSTVGMITRDFTDQRRMNWERTDPRPLRTAIWYPAAAGTGEVETIFGGPPERELFAPVTVQGGADISNAKQQYPLVLLSHGTGGSAVQMMWLGHYLAARGYIVAAVNHHGNTAAEKNYVSQGFLLYWERARDLSAVLDKILADPVFGPHIDRKHIGAAGFSLGGYTVIAIAGGRFNSSQFDSFCHSPEKDFTCGPQPEFADAPKIFAQLKENDPVVKESLRHSHDSFRDPRIKRVFAISPALGSGFRAADLVQVTVPVSIVVGAADKVAPPRTNAQRYARYIRGAKVVVLPGGIGHYTFLAECNAHGKSILDLCRDSASVDRAAVHRQVAEMAFEFFERDK